MKSKYMSLFSVRVFQLIILAVILTYFVTPSYGQQQGPHWEQVTATGEPCFRQYSPEYQQYMGIDIQGPDGTWSKITSPYYHVCTVKRANGMDYLVVSPHRLMRGAKFRTIIYNDDPASGLNRRVPERQV